MSEVTVRADAFLGTVHHFQRFFYWYRFEGLTVSLKELIETAHFQARIKVSVALRFP